MEHRADTLGRNHNLSNYYIIIFIINIYIYGIYKDDMRTAKTSKNPIVPKEVELLLRVSLNYKTVLTESCLSKYEDILDDFIKGTAGGKSFPRDQRRPS